MHVLSVVGARPQFVKLAPVARELERRGYRHTIVHTGQHYDHSMSDVFFENLRIDAPEVNLLVGSGSHAKQTAAMLEGMEPILKHRSPDWVLVYGDTNSTLAAAVCTPKLGIRLAHLEAGLRSHNRAMPEEHNRIVADHASDLCLAPTEQALMNLQAEGLGSRSVIVGDVMVDVLVDTVCQLEGRLEAVLAQLATPSEYYLATIHRVENTDNPEHLARIIRASAQASKPVLLAAHPRLVAAAREHSVCLNQGSISVITPQPYEQMVALVMGASGVITDSGGLQKEAFVLGRLCTTIRRETEWPETLHGGWNVLLSGDAVDMLPDVLLRETPPALTSSPFGDGTAAAQAVAALDERLVKKAPLRGEV
jgi:UDP-N-acetylglucosamine 2-epimerase (non-hydrolysing)